MFGRSKGDKPDFETYATYTGGHKAYPSSQTCKLKIFADHIEITKPEFSIPFSAMTKVEYSKKPTFGLMTTGTQTVTIIEYNDGNELQTIGVIVPNVLGAKNLDKVQGMLYERMLAARGNAESEAKKQG